MNCRNGLQTACGCQKAWRIVAEYIQVRKSNPELRGLKASKKKFKKSKKLKGGNGSMVRSPGTREAGNWNWDLPLHKTLLRLPT